MPKHSNPTGPRYDQKNRVEVEARAPYNFIPLNDKIVAAPLPQKIRDDEEPRPYDQDVWQGLTGTIEYELTTFAPTYIRGMLTEADWKAQRKEKLSKEGLSEASKETNAPFFSTEEPTDGERYGNPRIPGSSLRGMVRSLVEIVSFGRMRWVAEEPTFTFRAVAASKDDPLRDDYQRTVGPFGRNIKAGFLQATPKAGVIAWQIVPAASIGGEAFLKVRDSEISSQRVEDYLHFDTPGYVPQVHKVTFETDEINTERGKRTVVKQLKSFGAQNHRRVGYLVCSGNMQETDKATTDRRPSPRRRQALVLEGRGGRALEIKGPIVQGYLKGLTGFQAGEVQKAWRDAYEKIYESEPGLVEQGCLVDKMPVFYVQEGNDVVAFGHDPYFRLVAEPEDLSKPATPYDFLPEDHRIYPGVDFADALFGWVAEKADESGKQVGPENQRAGRVMMGDAVYVGHDQEAGLWYSETPITPAVLGSPKVTTFQHYLVQDRESRHDPDDKKSLAHYGTRTSETELRGYKLYWHRGRQPDIQANAKALTKPKQLTRIVPLNPGVRFRGRIHFENLHTVELGALLWALLLPGERGQRYAHKLGMGKPLGMGAVHLQPTLYVSDRAKRYGQLFDSDGGWHTATRRAEILPYVTEFEQDVLQKLRDKGSAQVPSQASRLADIERIQMLLTMLEWHEEGPKWADQLRYMEIERELPTANRSRTGKVETLNEYKERPVLPDPLAVAGVRTPQQESEYRRTLPRPAPRPVTPTVKSTTNTTPTTRPTVQAPVVAPPTTRTVVGSIKEIDSKRRRVRIAGEDGQTYTADPKELKPPTPAVKTRVQFDVVGDSKEARNIRRA